MDSSCSSVAIATTLKCPPSQATAFVNYYLNLGVDHIFLFFDDPQDPSADEFQQNPKVTVTRCTPDYFRRYTVGYFEKFDYQFLIYRQGLNATNALHWCRERHIDWIAHVDVDELIYPRIKNWKSLLRYSPFKILRLTVLEAVPEKLTQDTFFCEIRYFKAPAAFHKTWLRYPINSLLLKIAYLLGVRSPFSINDRFFRAHYKSKCLVRTDLDILDMRIHRPLTSRRRFEFRFRRIYLLHFDANGFDHWMERLKFKFAHGDRPVTKKNFQKTTRYLMDLFAAGASDEEFVDAYRRIHFISMSDIKVLRRFGLIREIHLPPAMFVHDFQYTGATIRGVQ